MKHLVFLLVTFFMFNTLVFAGSAPSATQTQIALENFAPAHQNPDAKVAKTTKAEKAELKAQKKAEKVARKLEGGKSRVVAILLCFFLGVFGIHRFYMGDTLVGVLQLISGGGFVIWFFIDLIRLICGGFADRF